jgi:putative flippase GtrA
VISGELLRYAAAGVANTVVGYAVFIVLLHVAGAPPLVANIGCYVIGLLLAYVLNLVFVFRHASHSRGSAVRFVGGAGAAWLVNAAVLAAAIELLHLRAEIAQAFAMVVYTGSFYLINRHFVWATR